VEASVKAWFKANASDIAKITIGVFLGGVLLFAFFVFLWLLWIGLIVMGGA